MYETIRQSSSMHDIGCLGLVYWDDPEGWYGEGGGRRVQDGEQHAAIHEVAKRQILERTSLTTFNFSFFLFLNFILFLNFTILY